MTLEAHTNLSDSLKTPIRQRRFLLIAILALAFALRFLGISFGLPHLYHADEPIVVNHAMAFGSGDLNPHFFKIPPLVSYALFALYASFYGAGHLFGFFRTLKDFEFSFYSDPTLFYLLGRLIFGAFLGTLTVYFLYRLARKHFSESKALLSSFFLAVAFLHVSDSHYIYADIPLVWVMVVAMGELLERPLLKKNVHHCFVGGLIGLAAAVKYNGMVLVIPYLFLTWKRRQSLKDFLIGVGGALLSCFCVYALLNPFSILDLKNFITQIQQESQAHQGGIGWLRVFREFLPESLGMPLALAAFLAFLRGIFIGRDENRLTLCLFLAAYYGILSRWGQPYLRYGLPMVPFCCLLAADLSEDFLGLMKSSAVKKLARVLLIVVLALPSLWKSVRFGWIMSRPDVRTLALSWIRKNLPKEEKIAMDDQFYMPRLRFSKSQLIAKIDEAKRDPHFSNAKLRRLQFLLDPSKPGEDSYGIYFLKLDPKGTEFLFSGPAISYDFDQLKKRGIRYVLVGLFYPDREPRDFFRNLEKEADLIQEFTPYRNSVRKWPITHPLTGGPAAFRDILERERNGQPIRIYRLRY